MPLTDRQVRDLQRDLNWFVKTFDLDFAPLKIDGDYGPATRRRVRHAKYLLGFLRENIDSQPRDEFLWRLTHPQHVRSGRNRDQDRRLVRRGRDRRRKHRRNAEENRYKAPSRGVATFDGRPVAAWMRPYLLWARDHGWDGHLNSGWRDPAHSERLCFEICGRPSCSGTCAGRRSSHSQTVKPAGAIDVSDQAEFGRLMRRCPLEPRIFNALGARDPWHYSSTGR